MNEAQTDLELASTEDLIEEIFKRKTFIGVLIYSPDAQKVKGQNHPELKLYTTVAREFAEQMLEIGMESLASQT
jgi:hypothetical protein